jgi:hypothetical protein
MVSAIYAECPIQALNAECHHVECRHIECRHAECHYGECRGAQRTAYTHPGKRESVFHSKVGSLPYPQTLN